MSSMKNYYFVGSLTSDNTKKGGFTLIELLVVISIISLLSSIVLSALSSARTKASDSQRNSIVGEYVKALALAYDASGTGQYPGPVNTTIYCLGDYPPTGVGNHNTSNACQYGLSSVTRSENASVLDAVEPYLASLPVLKLVTTATIYAWQGPFYTCNSTVNCSSPTIEWYLDQPNQKCIKGATTAPTGSGTKCSLTLQ